MVARFSVPSRKKNRRRWPATELLPQFSGTSVLERKSISRTYLSETPKKGLRKKSCHSEVSALSG